MRHKPARSLDSILARSENRTLRGRIPLAVATALFFAATGFAARFSMATAPAKRFAAQVAKRLRQAYPDARCALDFTNPLQLLVATILSAQCTDKRVNMVTPELFKKYPTAADLAAAPIARIERIIQSTGFFRNKAKNIQACCRKMVDEHGGEVPRTLEELVELPGVGRKTANVVLGMAFGIASGVVVDTHVGRIAQRLGLTDRTKTRSRSNAI